jgi:hypothetical protein
MLARSILLGASPRILRVLGWTHRVGLSIPYINLIIYFFLVSRKQMYCYIFNLTCLINFEKQCRLKQHKSTSRINMMQLVPKLQSQVQLRGFHRQRNIWIAICKHNKLHNVKRWHQVDLLAACFRQKRNGVDEHSHSWHEIGDRRAE